MIKIIDSLYLTEKGCSIKNAIIIQFIFVKEILMVHVLYIL